MMDMEPGEPVSPGGCRAAITLTYDDAIDVHLDHAMPDLERFGLRGTFYIPTGNSSCWTARASEWKAAGDRGHEVGNHTRLHPCSIEYEFIRKLGASRSLEAYTPGRMESELRAAEEDLSSVIGQAPRSFAYPCGQQFVGPDRQSYRPIVERLFPAARGVSGREIADPWTVDLHCTPGWSIEQHVEEASILSFIDEAIDAGGWAILLFHGVGGGHALNVSREVHQSLLRAIESRQSLAWCGTLIEVASRLRQVRRQPWQPGSIIRRGS